MIYTELKNNYNLKILHHLKIYMADNKYVGSFILRTIDIEPTRDRPTAGSNLAYNNDYGITDANSCFVLWKNVNIRTCLGELYNKYDKYNLKMTSFQVRLNASTGPTTDEQFVLYMSGLPFSNYNTSLGPNNGAALGCVNFNTTGTMGTTTSFTSGLVSFDKPLQDILNISILLKNSSTTISNGYSEASVNVMGHYSIICDIYGIE